MASSSKRESTLGKPRKKDKIRAFLRLPRKNKEGTSGPPGSTDPLTLDQVEAAVDSANDMYLEMRPAKSFVLTAFSNTMTMVGLGHGVEGAYGLLVENLWAFASLIEKLGEIHPYARMALSIFAMIPKAFIAQAKRNQAMKRLLDAMVDIYKFARRYKDVERLDDHRKHLLQKLLVQTVECAYYIRELARLRGLVNRSVRNILLGSKMDERFTDYTNVFIDLRRCLTERGALEVEIRVISALSSIAEQIELQDLTNVRGSGVNSSKACLPGTRESILDELSSWANDPEGPRVRFLLGLAGMGKSAVAHSLGIRFASLRRLGSFFAFDRNFQGDRHPETVLKTIARDLARWNPAFHRELAKAVRENGTLLHTDDIKIQWDELIVAPAKRVMFIGPVLIVIDAFDESSSIDGRSRRILLRRLTDGSQALPQNFRILVTSRPEDDIVSAIACSVHATEPFHLQPSPHDVEVYIRHTLGPSNRFQDHLSEAKLTLLVEKAAGVFQWAFTACRVLLERPSGLSVQERFDERLGGLIRNGSSSLDDLYSETLEHIFPATNRVALSRFLSVMALILCASRPLSMEELQIISSEVNMKAKDDASLVVLRMGAFLSGLDGPSSPIRPLHTSFRDFLLTESRSGQWHVDVLKGHSSVCLALARYLNRHLRFNMFDFPTSYLRTSRSSQSREQLTSSIMVYAAQFLKDHIPSLSILPHQTEARAKDLQAELRKLLCDNFLYWLELLSIHDLVNTATLVLQKTLAYSASVNYERKCDAFIHDAISFVRKFGRIIAQSAPHIYLSALPFSPTSSLVRNTFHSKFPYQVMPHGIADKWPQTQTIIPAKSPVLSSTFSPDSQRIISGSWDSAVRIWDAETGEAVGQPLHGHSAAVWSVAYSPDGRQIVSGSWDSTVRIWDAETSEAIGEPLQGHSARVYSVAYSPDGRQIVSGSDDLTLRIWDAEVGKAIGVPLLGHTSAVESVAYSPDGQRIVSGSSDSTVRIWDVETGKAIGEPFHGHSAAIYAVAYSPDGSRIVSGSSDSTVRIWDAGTGEAVGRPLYGHSAAIYSVAYSPDGRRIISGSDDSMVRIWDAETCEAVGEPLHGHSARIYSVMYSIDGQRIISGSGDSTVRIWDAHTDKAVSEPLHSHSAAIYSVAYSPDGRRIVSGSANLTVCIWDAETGEAIGEPLYGHSAAVFSVAYSPNGRRIVSGSWDATVRIWDAETSKAASEPLRGHSARVYSVAYSPDSRRIISGSDDSIVRIWDAETGEAVGKISHDSSAIVWSVAYSPDSRRIVSGTDDSMVRIWDAETEKAIGKPLYGHSARVYCVVYSPDGRQVASGSWDSTVRVWNAETGEAEGEPLRGHSAAVWSIAYSPSGRRIVSGSDDSTVRIWDAHIGNAIGKPLYGHSAAVESVAYSPEGRWIVSSSEDSTVRIWDAGTSEAIGEYHSAANPNWFLQNLTFEKEAGISAPQAAMHRVRMTDGWIVDDDDNLIIWVPDEYRNSLWWPAMRRLISGRRPSLTIDFRNAKIGRDWAQIAEVVVE